MVDIRHWICTKAATFLALNWHTYAYKNTNSRSVFKCVLCAKDILSVYTIKCAPHSLLRSWVRHLQLISKQLIWLTWLGWSWSLVQTKASSTTASILHPWSGEWIMTLVSAALQTDEGNPARRFQWICPKPPREEEQSQMWLWWTLGLGQKSKQDLQRWLVS